MVCLAAEPVGSDTLADWDLKVPNFANTMSVLDGSDGNYYIYPNGERGIPYVLIRAYQGYSDGYEFLIDFTDNVMKPNYPDLSFLSEISPVTIDGAEYYELDYDYTVSGYVCVDRRLARTVGDWTYMFASKEIPELDLTVGTLLEDTISGCEFLGAGSDLPVPEGPVELPPTSVPEPAPQSDIEEITCPDDLEELLAEEGLYGSFYVFDEVDAKIWIPDILESVPLTDADREAGYIAYFSNADMTCQIGVQYIFVDMTQEEYKAFVEAQPLVSETNEIIINDIPFLVYKIPDNNVMVLSTVTSAGYVMEFAFFPAEGEAAEEFYDYFDIMGTSIQPE